MERFCDCLFVFQQCEFAEWNEEGLNVKHKNIKIHVAKSVSCANALSEPKVGGASGLGKRLT